MSPFKALDSGGWPKAAMRVILFSVSRFAMRFWDWFGFGLTAMRGDKRATAALR
jgi:hypothetical protein